MKRLAALSLILLTVSCRKTVDPKLVENDVTQWQKKRAERLRAEDGWLSLVGLYWLHEGENRFGSDRTKNDMVFPAGAPAQAGKLTMQQGRVTLDADVPMTADGKLVSGPVTLVDDADGAKSPTIVQLGSMRFNLIKRNDRYGIRVKDPQSDARTHFKGLDYFPIDPKWHLEARFEPYNPPKKIAITNVLGMTSEEIAPGALVFTVDGKEVRLDPILERGETDLFLIFKDETSRDATYPAARYLYAKPPDKDGKTIVDFNKAYNPPCAFTPYATCPLPPPQNKLPFRIEAGEKRYAGGHA